MRVGLVSAKGSPGVTTVSLCVAAAAGGFVVEADPAGGDVECWAGPRGEPGLIRLAGVVRHAAEPGELVAEHAVEVWPGVRVVLAPVGAEQAESTLVALGSRLAAVLCAEPGWVVVDGGRWARSQATARRLLGCDVVGVVVSSTLLSVAHSRPLVAALRAVVDVPVVAVVVGDRGYPSAEIATALDVPVVGAVPWEPRWVRSLMSSGASRMWSRSPLARSVRSLTGELSAVALKVPSNG